MTSWRVDETYVKVGGKWKYLFRAVDKHGRLIDAGRSPQHAGSPSFSGKSIDDYASLAAVLDHHRPAGSYPKAICRLRREGKPSADTRHRTSNYLNNIIEADHGALKRVIRPTRGFQTMRTAAATIKGFEVMRMIRRGHCLTCKPHVQDEVRLINKLFDVFPAAAA